MGDRRPDAADLVGRDAGPDPGAADEDPAVGLAVADRERQAAGEVRVVVVRVGAVAAEVDQLVAGVGEPGEQLVLELGAAVVGGEGDAHQRPSSRVRGAAARRTRPAEALADDPRARRPPRASAVKPNSFRIVPAGAEAPKWSRATIAPSSPAQRSQPSETPISTATRFRAAAGRTDSRYAASWASKASQQGRLTTRVAIPSASRASAAATASWTSEPVAT